MLMKTKVEKEKSIFRDNLFKLTVTMPRIGAGKDHVFYFIESELDELVEQIKEVKNKCVI